jgi:hypothetical protein
MITATDVINQARYSEEFTVRAKIGNFSLTQATPWNISVSYGVLEVKIPALTLEEARYKAKQIIISEYWEDINET